MPLQYKIVDHDITPTALIKFKPLQSNKLSLKRFPRVTKTAQLEIIEATMANHSYQYCASAKPCNSAPPTNSQTQGFRLDFKLIAKRRPLNSIMVASTIESSNAKCREAINAEAKLKLIKPRSSRRLTAYQPIPIEINPSACASQSIVATVLILAQIKSEHFEQNFQ